MTDIVKRLRDRNIRSLDEPAAEIIRLRKENAQLKKKFDTLYDAYTKLRNKPIQIVGSVND